MLEAPRKPVGWARVYAAMQRSLTKILRQGVWYPVVNDEQPDRVTLMVGERRVDVPRKLMEIRSHRPSHFSVIQPFDAAVDILGKRYTVCPNCGHRGTLNGEPNRRDCTKCGHKGEVGWWE
jgi:hypothetical protein